MDDLKAAKQKQIVAVQPDMSEMVMENWQIHLQEYIRRRFFFGDNTILKVWMA